MSKFPASGPLSVSTIGGAFGLAYPISMGSFIGKPLYNTNGTIYTVPGGSVNIGYFYGRYYTNPYIAPITRQYTTSGIITPPSGQLRNPTSYTVTVIGPGGGGGGGGGGKHTEELSSDNRTGGGGGGGGGGGKLVVSNILYGSDHTITVTIDSSANSGGLGGAGISCYFYCNADTGGEGVLGTATILLINTSLGTIVNCRAGAGTNAAGGEGGAWYNSGGAGGGLGTGGTNTITVGNSYVTENLSGRNGANGDPGKQILSGGSGGAGGYGGPSYYDAYYGGGGYGGGGGNGDGSPGGNGDSGTPGIIEIVWDYTI